MPRGMTLLRQDAERGDGQKVRRERACGNATTILAAS